MTLFGGNHLIAKELGTDDICILLAWQRVAIRLGELWNAHIRLAKEHGDIGFIREQEAVADLRLLCATLPPNNVLGGLVATKKDTNALDETT